jgi:hypothetical protein
MKRKRPMYRSTSEAFANARYIKPWHSVCKAASEQYEAAVWIGRPVEKSATQIVRDYRRAK